MPYIYSSLTADNEYSTPAGVITIYGRLGAKNNRRIDTPRGVATLVTDEQAAALKQHPTFKSHLNNNHVSIQAKELTEAKVERLGKLGDLRQDSAAQETKETLKKKSKAELKEG